MTLGKRPISYPQRPTYRRRGGGPPGWLVFILGIAVVFGMYYVWLGLREYLATSGLGETAATNLALTQERPTETAALAAPNFQGTGLTPGITATDIPACVSFVVSVPSAIVRAAPSTNSPILDALSEGEEVCVINTEADGEWYLIDRNPRTRRIDSGYMAAVIIEAINPTPTASRTFTPAPTVTDVPTTPPTYTLTPRPTRTPDPASTETPTIEPSPTPSPSVRSA